MPRILIIDDDPSMVSILAQSCHEKGFATLSYTTAEHAMHHMVEDKPDLIICDLRIGEASGSDVLRFARERLPSIPVVVITAFSSETVRRQVMALGAFAFILKPFKIDDLQCAISAALHHDGAFAAEHRPPELLEMRAQVARLAEQAQHLADLSANVAEQLKNLIR